MDRGWMIAAVAVSAAITFFLRALPFFAFRDGRKMPEKLKRLGGILPSAIMAVLIVYCLKDVLLDFKNFILMNGVFQSRKGMSCGIFFGYGMSELISACLVAVSYKYRHHTMLSIALGTVCNIILLHLFMKF